MMWAIVVAILAVTVLILAVTFWFVVMILPLVLAAALIAYLGFRATGCGARDAHSRSGAARPGRWYTRAERGAGDGLAGATLMPELMINVVLRQRNGLCDLDVTIRSKDTGWERYADRIEALAPDGTVLGTRIWSTRTKTSSRSPATFTNFACPRGSLA